MEAVAEPGGRESRSVAGTAFSLGLMWALSILIGIYGGRWLDERLHTDPLFMIVGLLMGLASGTVSTVRAASRFQKRSPR